MNGTIFVPTVYKSKAEADLEVAAGKPKSAETPQELVNQDALLDELDSILARFDKLTAKLGNFPAEAKEAEARYEALAAQELDSIKAIESRSAEMSKAIAMREVLTVQRKKVQADMMVEQEAAIKIGTQIAHLLESRWWSNYNRRAAEIERKFNQLLYQFGLEQNLRDAYLPIVLLQWIKPPNFYFARFTPPDVKITSCRGLRKSANQLAEFDSMSFAQITARIEQIDRENRERARERDKIGSEF